MLLRNPFKKLPTNKKNNGSEVTDTRRKVPTGEELNDIKTKRIKVIILLFFFSRR
ncbi:hypothetical protein AGMMS50212_10850 [Spirochaetia bacterium]|nr:hypothetical protein AGMMS50212_10850 [Spirochaetia bacterium]